MLGHPKDIKFVIKGNNNKKVEVQAVWDWGCSFWISIIYFTKINKN
jgi:hypothetical protein